MAELIAHRGASRLRHENTLPAFELALEQSADGIELDVHATKDGVVVVHHDADVPVGEQRIAIRGTPYAALREIALVSGDPIPTLADVLALVGDRATVYVEIKGAGIEAAVAGVLRSARTRCAVHSFDHRAVLRHQHLAPEIPTGVLSASYPIDNIGPVKAARARTLWQEWHLIDEELVRQAHASDIRVIAWTVNSESAVHRLTAFGVDALCGDDIQLLRRALS